MYYIAGSVVGAIVAVVTLCLSYDTFANESHPKWLRNAGVVGLFISFLSLPASCIVMNRAPLEEQALALAAILILFVFACCSVAVYRSGQYTMQVCNITQSIAAVLLLAITALTILEFLTVALALGWCVGYSLFKYRGRDLAKEKECQEVAKKVEAGCESFFSKFLP